MTAFSLFVVSSAAIDTLREMMLVRPILKVELTNVDYFVVAVMLAPRGPRLTLE